MHGREPLIYYAILDAKPYESILVVCAIPVIPAILYACFIIFVLILKFA
jgi:hypothetical protein